jgi:hypothetical protein
MVFDWQSQSKVVASWKKPQKIKRFSIGFANAGFASSKTVIKIIFELTLPALAKPIKKWSELE